MDYSEIYFAVASISTIAVASILLLCLLYVLRILLDIRKLSKIARKEAEMIARGIQKGASLFAAELSAETSSFVRTLFALLLSHFVPTKTKSRRSKISKQD